MMKIIVVVLVLLIAGCKEKNDASLLGRWQIMRLEGRDSAGKEMYVFDSRRDTAKKYVSFINDTTYTADSAVIKNQQSKKSAVDTVRYLLVGDSIFSKRGIRNYSLNMITSDSILITGDDHSSITIVRVERNRK